MSTEEFANQLDAWSNGDERFPSFDNYTCSTVEEAQAIVRALRSGDLFGQQSPLSSPFLFHVVGFMQGNFSDDADSILHDEALPILRELLREGLSKCTPTEDYATARLHDTYLFALKNLAYYGDPADIPLIVEAARNEVFEDNYMWCHILEYSYLANPEAERLLEQITDPLPESFLRVAFLDFANDMCSDDRGKHPFDNDVAMDWLLRHFEIEDESYDSYAVSAIRSSSFLSDSNFQRLLQAAENHPRASVRSEIDWARARRPDSNSDFLVDKCRDPRSSTRARHYLESLGKTDQIPELCSETDHVAVANVSDWLLEEPDFFGFPADHIQMIDHQVLNWIPSGTKEIRLVQFDCNQSDDRGYNGIIAVGEDLFFILGTKSIAAHDDLIECYTELLAEDSNFNADDDARELLLKLNPGLAK